MGVVKTAAATLRVQNGTALAVSAAGGVYGGTANLTATLTSGTPASGVSGETISFTLNGSPAGSAVTNASGVATVNNASLAGIAVGSYPSGVGASFAGDATNGPQASSGTGSLTVNKADTTTTITAPGTNPATSVGQAYTVSWTVAPVAPGSGTPTGTVTVSDGTDSCSAAVGAGSCSLTSTTAGSPKTLTATYSGDTNFNGSSGTQTHNVNKVDATTSVSSSQNPSVFGQSVTFTATVTAAGAQPTGTVQFVVDGGNFGLAVALTAGSATSGSTSSLTVAGSPHSVTATYSGDGNYNTGTSGTLAGGQKVNKADTTTAITNPTDLAIATVVGQSYTVKWSVSVTGPGSGTPTGTVTVAGGSGCSAPVASGQCDVVSTTAGAKTLTATYGGDANFNASPASGEVGHQVNPASTTTSVSSSANPSVFGQSVTFTATVAAVAPGAGTPTGSVQFRADGVPIGAPVPLSGGSANVSKSDLTVAGSAHAITAEYSNSDGNFNNSTGTLSGGQTVNKADTTASITSDAPDPSVKNQAVPVHYTVSVTAPGGGTIPGTDDVTVSDGTDSCTGTVTAGQCNVTLNTVGTRTLKATYQGGDNYKASPASPGESHDVVNPASLSVTSFIGFDLLGGSGDTVVRATQSVRNEFTIANGAAPRASATGMTPTALAGAAITATGTASAGPCSGPVPGSNDIAAGSDQTFRYTCGPVSGDGTLKFTASAPGTEQYTGNSLNVGPSTTNTVLVDSTPPDVSITPASGNVSSPLTFSWSVTDPTVPAVGGVTSGVNTSSCTLKIDTAAPVGVPCTSSNSSLLTGTHDVVVSGSDNAGNSNSASRHYVLDDKPPVVTVSFPGPNGSNGWFKTSPVTGSVSATDPSNVASISCSGAALSLVTGTGTPTASGTLTVSAEGTSSVICTATDGAGNPGADTGSVNTATIMIDTQAPTGVAGAANRVPDHNGWYTSAVAITFSGTDTTSTIASCTSTNYSGPDNGSASLSGHCTDAAGNSSSDVAFTFKYDATPPSVTASADRSPDHNGWYNKPLTVSFNGTDTTSGGVTCDAAVSYSGPDNSSGSVSGECTDAAGNKGTGTLNFQYDATPPTNVAGALARGPDHGAWYNQPVKVSFGGEDPISGIDTCTSLDYSGPDNSSASVPGSCTDKAGNTAAGAPVTFQYDSTPPTVTVALARAADHNGWYNQPVGFTVSGSDAVSGVASCDANGTYSAPDALNASIAKSCTDDAGNIGHGSVNFQYDSTPPTGVSGAPNRVPDHKNWYNQAVDVVFTGTDATSQIDSCTTVTYSSPDTTTASVNGRCADKAGNSSDDVASSTFKFDATPPTAALALAAGTPGTHGWYVSDVTVSTSGNDTVSNPTTCTADQFQTTETVGQVFSGSCTNDAGLTQDAVPLTVKLDKTAPTAVALSAAGTLGRNNWYTSDVTVSTNGSENISNPISCTGDQYQTTDATGQVFHGSCTNDAGLSANASDITIKRDATPPVLQLAFAPDSPNGNNGWWVNSGGVPFAWTCSDATSGIDATYNPCPTPASSTVTANGSTPFEGQVRDEAGNLSAHVMRTLKLDNVAPVITWNTAGDTCSLPGNAGWCRGTETAAFTANDPGTGSGLVGPASFTQSTGTNGSAVNIPSGSVADAAGNVNSGINAGPYKIDSQPPTISVLTPANGATYLFHQALAASFSCLDQAGLSGVANCDATLTNSSGTSSATNGTNVTGVVNSNTFKVVGTDVAGNPAVPVTNTYYVHYATGTVCSNGMVGHQINPPINLDNLSVFKSGSTVPTKFTVCDANGTPIGTAGVVAGYNLVFAGPTQVTGVNELVYSNTPDTAFRWDSTAQQWIFNQATGAKKDSNLTQTGVLYGLRITLNDGTPLDFAYTLK